MLGDKHDNCRILSGLQLVFNGERSVARPVGDIKDCGNFSGLQLVLNGERNSARPVGDVNEDKDFPCGAEDRIAARNVHNKCSASIRQEDVEGCLRGDICSNARCPFTASSGLCQDTSAPVMQWAAGGIGIRSRDEQAQAQGSSTRTQQDLRVDSRSIDNNIKVESSNTSHRLFGSFAGRFRCEGGALGVHTRSNNQT